MLTRSLLAACCLLALSACWAADPIATTVRSLPADVVEGQPLRVTVAYDVPAALGEVKLHVELKSPRHANVLAGQTFSVKGKGEVTAAVPAPPRQEEALVFFALWYGEVWTSSIGAILTTDQVAVLSQEEAAAARAGEAAARQWREAHAGDLDAGPAVAVLVDDLPGLDRACCDRLLAALKQAGLRPVPLTATEAANPGLLSTDNFSLLVLPNSAAYPLDGARALERYLTHGGDVIALGAPAFRQGLRRLDGQWLGEEQLAAKRAAQPTEKVLFGFEAGTAKDWGYTSGGGKPAEYTYAAGGAADTRQALHCLIPEFTSWNTLLAPELTGAFEAGQTLTCFWARGDAATTALSVEWVEQDGSRWIATVPLATSWQRYALPPQDFRYWKDNPSKGRGGANDHFRPENARKLTVGLSMTHTPLPGGRHEFWIDELGVARDPLQPLAAAGAVDLGPLELLTPEYKFHRVSNAATLRVSDKQVLLPAASFPVPAHLQSVQPRPQGTGYNKERKWRFVPLLEAYDREGEVCGTPACLVINRTGRLQNSQLASFALSPAACDTPEMLGLIAQLAVRMQQGYYLFEGGAEFYCYWDGQEVKLGARTIQATAAREPRGSVNFTVTTDGEQVYREAVALTDGVAEGSWKPGRFAQDTYQVTCELRDAGGQVLDRLSHPLLVWRAPAKPDFMKIVDGHFVLHGKPWRAHGVNYMPASGIGIEDGGYFEHWIGKQAYDPVVIERDLQRVKAAGMNMVSIFCYYESLPGRNLLDCLERCRRLGLMVNLSLRPGTPMDFRFEEMKALIEGLRLAENDTIFAYDLAWEPSYGNHESQKRWDAEWEKWVAAQYGSLAGAEADWGVPIPREDGKVTGPSDEQLRTEGPHRVMVCAYRRFLDDWLAKKHALAFNYVKSLDPNHPTSFRMSIAGDPTVNPAWIGYDFRGLARSVDLMEPEGYGRIGDWNRVRDGRFTVDYARAMAPGRPVIWAEFGWAPYQREAWDISATWLRNVGEYYDRFYRMANEANADGTVSWWYPGGFRVGENSDYGIINPDVSPRPVTEAIRRWADRMTTTTPRPVDEWLVMDRDASVKGIVGCYEAVKERYFALTEAGKNPGLRTDGYGLTSATAPRRAVGNVEYKPGRNPHKYLNAEIDRVEVKGAGGAWQPLEGPLPVGKPVTLRVTVGNLGEARWLAAAGPGQVTLQAGGAAAGSAPLAAEVPFTGTAVVEITVTVNGTGEAWLRMHAAPDVVFGEKLALSGK